MNTKLAITAVIAALALTACAKQEATAPEAPAADTTMEPAADATAADEMGGETTTMEEPADATATGEAATAETPAEQPQQ